MNLEEGIVVAIVLLSEGRLWQRYFWETNVEACVCNNVWKGEDGKEANILPLLPDPDPARDKVRLSTTAASATRASRLSVTRSGARVQGWKSLDVLDRHHKPQSHSTGC